MLDISPVVPKNFSSQIAISTTVEFGDGTEEGDIIHLSILETSTAPYLIVVTWGTTSGGADDAPTPVLATLPGTPTVGLPIIVGREFLGRLSIRVGKSVKYAKILNTDIANPLNNLSLSFLEGAKRN